MSPAVRNVFDFLTRSPRRIAAAALAAVVVILLTIHLINAGKVAPGLLPPSTSAIPNQPVGTVTSTLLPITRAMVGTIQSRLPIDAASRVAATVKEVRVRAGDHVKRGQVLVVLDSADLQANVAGAQAELDAARAQFVRTEADEKRFSALFKRGSATEREFQEAEAAWRSATARVAQAQAAVAAARAALDHATVVAPVSGIVAERMVEPGDLALPGKPLVRLYDNAALRVELNVPEELLREVKIGMPVSVRIDATGEDIRTAINEIVPEADPSSRTFLARAPMPTGRGIQPGMFARATLSVGSEKILTVPRDAIETIGQLDTVRVISRGRVELRQVSTGRAIGDRVEILAGLREGEKVLLNPQNSNHR
jgi:RND family efflux transporter MFP subunit